VKLKGLAFFDVAKDEKKTFQIETGEVDVTVLGTSFSVRAIESEPTIEVVVKTGKVQVKGKGNRTTLTKGGKAIYNKNQRHMTTTSTKTLNELSWQSKTLIFDDTPLTEVVSDVENHYGIVLNLKDSNLAACPFNSIFKNKTITEVFDAISKTFKIEIEETADYVYDLKGGQCPMN